MAARAAHHRADQVTTREAAAFARDDREQLVAEDELPAIVRRDAERALKDLAVGPAHAHLEDAEEHALAGRLVDLLDPRRVRGGRLGDERLHGLRRGQTAV